MCLSFFLSFFSFFSSTLYLFIHLFPGFRFICFTFIYVFVILQIISLWKKIILFYFSSSDLIPWKTFIAKQTHQCGYNTYFFFIFIISFPFVSSLVLFRLRPSWLSEKNENVWTKLQTKVAKRETTILKGSISAINHQIELSINIHIHWSI